MRVTFAIAPTAGLIKGGAETQAEQTAVELRKLGHEVDFLDHRTPNLGDIVHAFGINIVWEQLSGICAQKGVPLIVSSIWYTPTASSKFWRLRLKGKIRGHEMNLMRRIFGRAEMVLPNTQAELEQINSVFEVPREKLSVVPNGVEERFAYGNPDLFRNQFNIQGDFVLNVARIEGRKNQLSLIRACKLANLPLVIIGAAADPGLAEQCRREAVNTTFLDRMDHDDPLLASAYAACRVFALPSMLETPGIAAMEAALAGAKVVVTPTGGPREYFGDMAWYPDVTSPEDIGAKLKAAWQSDSDPDHLRQHLLKNYSWKRVAELTADAYQKII